jgi:hypothetical protein
MKSIDIRSESAVKLLAEFLDMDAPYMEGGRHVNAEHFAHGKSRRKHLKMDFCASAVFFISDQTLMPALGYRSLLICQIALP